MIVCITEKPSVGRDIARILGATEKHEGYFQGNGYQVTWSFGHLCTLKEPSDYNDNWKNWNLSSLPMIPQRFGIKLIDQDGYKKQFDIISSLLQNADEVINCGDAGQEGELIQRWILQKAGNKAPVKRLWISSLTDDSIRKGFHNLYDSQQFDNLYLAGLSRAIGDWLLGLNSTRLYSLRYSSQKGAILSVGRVQTPTLAMVVERQKEIDSFKSSHYWELKITYKEISFAQTPSKKFKSEKDGLALIESLTGFPFEIINIEKKKGKESAPRLFDLTSLQIECNNKFGWSAEETLRLIQSLYEKKLTTYPRVDTTYLSEDIYNQLPDILDKLTPYSTYTKEILKHKIIKSKRIFDNTKVTDHHAIIPTGETPRILTDPNERKLYHLIVLRFLANFYPDCNFLTTQVLGKINDVDFKVTGKVIEAPGWRTVLNGKEGDSKGDEAQLLPEFIVGEKGNWKPNLLMRTTQPPKYFTEATLLKAMESAGKAIDTEELRDALKENGIGRPSTRAAIIETLLKRGYIERHKKQLKATEAGKKLISLINDELLKSPKLTGLWENRLRKIEKGEYSATEFIEQLKNQLQEIIHSVLNDTANSRIHSEHCELKEVPKNLNKKLITPLKKSQQ